MEDVRCDSAVRFQHQCVSVEIPDDQTMVGGVSASHAFP
jgi:hypothetical protein